MIYRRPFLDVRLFNPQFVDLIVCKTKSLTTYSTVSRLIYSVQFFKRPLLLLVQIGQCPMLNRNCPDTFKFVCSKFIHSFPVLITLSRRRRNSWRCRVNSELFIKCEQTKKTEITTVFPFRAPARLRKRSPTRCFRVQTLSKPTP